MNSEHQKKRSRSIILAVFTSIISKGGNVLLMLLAIPLAYQVLGEERAAIYGVMQSLMWLVSMADLGTGPGMVRRLAGAVAEEDKDRQAAVVSTGFFLSLMLALIAGLLFSALLAWVPVTTLFSDAFAPYADELEHTAWVSLAVFLILMVLASLERVREGFQEVHIGNTFGSVYNVCAAIVLWLGMSYFHTPVFLVLAVYGLLIFFCSANVANLLWKRPWLRPSLKRLDRSVVRGMTREGLALFAAGSVAPILIREAPKFMLGRAGAHAASDVAHYWILIQLGLIGMGFIMMVTRPLWPAMAEAAYRHDYSWIRFARQRMMHLFAPCAVIVVCAFSLLGPWFTSWWLKTNSGLTRMDLTAYGVLFVLTAWSHMHYVMLGSLGMARAAAKVLLIEAFLILFLTWWGIQWQGLLGAIVAACAGMVAVSAWAMPLLLGRALRDRSGPRTEAEPVMVPA
jgi:O-antigen/teichoic acid export membrane protein